MKIEGLILPDEVPTYFQAAALDRVRLVPDVALEEDMEGTHITGFAATVVDGDIWQGPRSSDVRAGANRTEARIELEHGNGVTMTVRYDRILRPETYPLYGHRQPNLKQTLGQWFNGKRNWPAIFNRLEGDRETLFINSHAEGDRKFEVMYPFAYGSRRIVTTTTWHRNGTGAVDQWIDGVRIVSLRGYPFADPGDLGEHAWKGGVYLRKGAGNLVNGAPTLTAEYRDFRQYEGPARESDIGRVVRPFTPRTVAIGSYVDDEGEGEGEDEG